MNGQRSKAAGKADGELVAALSMLGYWEVTEPPPAGPSLATKMLGEEAGGHHESDRIRQAILLLQRTYGLAETGEADQKTRALLFAPQCGVSDLAGEAQFKMLLKEGWKNPHVTYQFHSWLPGIGEASQRQCFQNAFTKWSDTCRLSFEEVGTQGDIRIHLGKHDCHWPFRTHPAEVAHAFFPDHSNAALAGDLHVNYTLEWVTVAQAGGHPPYDFETVLLHEIGHSVGLTHSTDPNDVMYRSYAFKRDLRPRDIARIRALYGQ